MPNPVWLFALPLISSLLLFALPPLPTKIKKGITVILSILPLLLLAYGNIHWIGAEASYPWLPPLSVNFILTIDPLALLFLSLVSIIIPISILSMSSSDISYPNIFYGLIILLQAFLIGFFTSRDLVLFTIFWEAMLLPVYFIINIWGGPQKRPAAMKFLVYMIAGSTLLILAVLSLYFTSIASTPNGSFDLQDLAKITSQSTLTPWVCAIFLLAFAVKTPLFPFHAWLPDAYCQAPTAGTILLSGLLSKAGVYGVVRIGLGLFPALLKEWSPALLALAIAGVFYGAFAAWTQKDFKRLIAYSSFSHVNFILAGLFIWNGVAHEGAILQAFNHGITITALFLAAGWLESRLGTTQMDRAQGFAYYFPRLCWLTLFFVLSAVALPGTNNFVGELLILYGLFGHNPWLAAFLGLTVILSVIYMLRWMQKVYFDTSIAYQGSWPDIGTKQFAIAAPLVALILWIGIYPTPFLTLIKPITDTAQIAQREVHHQ